MWVCNSVSSCWGTGSGTDAPRAAALEPTTRLDVEEIAQRWGKQKQHKAWDQSKKTQVWSCVGAKNNKKES